MSCSGRRCCFAPLAPIVITCSILSASAEAQGPLFESSDILQLRIEAPFRRMISNEEGRFPASMVLADTPEDTIKETALKDERIVKFLGSKEIKMFIVSSLNSKNQGSVISLGFRPF